MQELCKRVLLPFFLFLMLISFVLAANDFGYDNPKLPKLEPKEPVGTILNNITNYSINVDRADFWDELNTPADIDIGDLGDGADYIPYIGATDNVNLKDNNLTINDTLILENDEKGGLSPIPNFINYGHSHFYDDVNFYSNVDLFISSRSQPEDSLNGGYELLFQPFGLDWNNYREISSDGNVLRFINDRGNMHIQRVIGNASFNIDVPFNVTSNMTANNLTVNGILQTELLYNGSDYFTLSELNQSTDLSGYVKNTGDTINGDLNVTGDVTIETAELEVNGNENAIFTAMNPDDLENTFRIISKSGITNAITQNLKWTGSSWDNDEDGQGTTAIGMIDGTIKLYTRSEDNVFPSERMRLTNDGKVIIGSTLPYRKFTVRDSIARTTTGDSEVMRIVGTSGVVGRKTEYGIALFDGSTYKPWATWGYDITAATGYNLGDMYWALKNTSVGNTIPIERMRLTSDGNLGIGTTSPSFPLEVAGNSSGISIYSHANISAEDYITRTSIYDKTEGDALSKIKDSDYYLTDDKIDHSKFYGYVTYDKRDLNRPVIETYDCSYNETTPIMEGDITNNKEDIILIEKECNQTIYPYTIQEEGVSLNKEIDVLRQAVYELKIQNEDLRKRVEVLEK